MKTGANLLHPPPDDSQTIGVTLAMKWLAREKRWGRSL
ncbi:hypothetical protein RISK_006753 [Rhodopirellula islandica]|uniref:Uncharacterized protein n=1 Tax=Rhodopirellula islandica TaxID=595434 RepID=A0A0J1E6V0_RHOIS|nr:hypothetical protein RISK_006753 [Rhodopirellula islandica]